MDAGRQGQGARAQKHVAERERRRETERWRRSGSLPRAPAPLRGGPGDGLAVIPGAREAPATPIRNFEFRQDSDFYFLTGFDEPDAVAVFNPPMPRSASSSRASRDREQEIWTGRRAGVEGAIAAYGADAAYTIDELDARLREYAIDRAGLVYRLGNPHLRRPRHAPGVRDARDPGARLHHPRAYRGAGPILHELRLRRAPEELARQRRACEISRDAHIEAMRFARPGQYEYEVQAALEFVFRKAAPRATAYPSIVASGPNACILHYNENRRRMEDGDLLLIDAGCEWGYHAADITRTFPVNGASPRPSVACTRWCCAPAGGHRAARPCAR